jgi:outer membrane lipoprotein
MMRRLHYIAAALTLTLLVACATPFDVGTANRTLTPQAAAGNLGAAQGTVVAWGGSIVAAQNFENSTEFEVLAFPLDRDNRPQRGATPTGRFIAVYPGFVETADYGPGREISVIGKIESTRTGTVGQARYVYPVLGASRMHLWPKDEGPASSTQPTIHFGIGIGVTR